MAREVIADIDFDQSGVVTLGRVGQSMGGLESQTIRTANVFTARMFNMRAAAMALIGSFSVAGIILGLKSLITNIVQGDSAFKDFQLSAKGVADEFARLAREAFNVGGGLQGATTWMVRIEASLLAIRQMAESAPAQSAGSQGVIAAVLFGIPGIGPLLQNLDQAGNAIDMLTKKQQAAILKGRENFDPKRVEDWEAAVKKALAALPGDEGSKPLGTIGPGFRLIEGQIIPKAERLPDILEPATETFEEWGTLFVGFENSFNDVGENIREWDITGKTEEIKQMSEASQLAADAIVAIGQSITQHILQGGLTFKAVFADMLMAMVPVLLGLAAIHLLEYDFAGAAYAFGAAIAAAAAAKALGSGSQRQYGSPAGATAPTAHSTTHLQVTFAGPTFGFNEHAFARYIMDLQRQGARGGG